MSLEKALAVGATGHVPMRHLLALVPAELHCRDPRASLPSSELLNEVEGRLSKAFPPTSSKEFVSRSEHISSGARYWAIDCGIVVLCSCGTAV